MSKAVGAPVRLQMMRWDEHGWTHYGPAIMYDMRAGIDAKGNMVAYEATGFGQGGTGLYTARELLGAGPGSPSATANALPTKVNGSGAVTENLSPWMKVSGTNYKVINKPIDSTMGILLSGALRAPGAQQTTLADAQIMDMLAVAAGMDSLAFRLQNMNTDLDGQRWAATLQAAATAAGWKPWVAGSNLSKENVVTGRGIANSHHGGAYAAVVADVQVNKKSGQDPGHPSVRGAGLRVLDEPEPDLQPDARQPHPGHEPRPDRGGHVQQEPGDEPSTGSAIRSFASRTPRRWSTCSCRRPDQPSLGSGEPPTCPLVGAIANAFFDATGVRMHEAPFTAGRVRATLKAAGVSVADRLTVTRRGPGIRAPLNRRLAQIATAVRVVVSANAKRGSSCACGAWRRNLGLGAECCTRNRGVRRSSPALLSPLRAAFRQGCPPNEHDGGPPYRRAFSFGRQRR